MHRWRTSKDGLMMFCVWCFSLIPLACSPQIQPVKPEQPETGPSPHYSKACPPRYPYAAVNSTGGESACACEARRKTLISSKEGLLLQKHAAKITVMHSQNEGDVVDKVFDSKKHKKGGYLPFFPAVGRNLGDFCFVLQEEKLVICKNKQASLSELEPMSDVLGLKWRLLTVEEGEAEVEVLHQVGVSHHHVKHVPGFGLDVAADRHVLPVGQHHGHLPLGRTGAALFGLRQAHRHRTPHVHMKNTPTYMYTWRCVH